MREFWIAAALVVASGCAEMEKAQLEMHGQFTQGVVQFGEASRAYVRAADAIAAQKHQLQGTLIQRTSEQWVKDHTGPDGRVVASASEMATFLKQRDGAVELLYASREVWRAESENYARTIDRIVKLAEQVYQRDLDVAKAKEEVAGVADAALKLIGGAGAASAILVPLGF